MKSAVIVIIVLMTFISARCAFNCAAVGATFPELVPAAAGANDFKRLLTMIRMCP
jgi:hypothetical protein